MEKKVRKKVPLRRCYTKEVQCNLISEKSDKRKLDGRQQAPFRAPMDAPLYSPKCTSSHLARNYHKCNCQIAVEASDNSTTDINSPLMRSFCENGSSDDEHSSYTSSSYLNYIQKQKVSDELKSLNTSENCNCKNKNDQTEHKTKETSMLSTVSSNQLVKNRDFHPYPLDIFGFENGDANLLSESKSSSLSVHSAVDLRKDQDSSIFSEGSQNIQRDNDERISSSLESLKNGCEEPVLVIPLNQLVCQDGRLYIPCREAKKYSPESKLVHKKTNCTNERQKQSAKRDNNNRLAGRDRHPLPSPVAGDGNMNLVHISPSKNNGGISNPTLERKPRNHEAKLTRKQKVNNKSQKSFYKSFHNLDMDVNPGTGNNSAIRDEAKSCMERIHRKYVSCEEFSPICKVGTAKAKIVYEEDRDISSASTSSSCFGQDRDPFYTPRSRIPLRRRNSIDSRKNINNPGEKAKLAAPKSYVRTSKNISQKGELKERKKELNNGQELFLNQHRYNCNVHKNSSNESAMCYKIDEQKIPKDEQKNGSNIPRNDEKYSHQLRRCSPGFSSLESPVVPSDSTELSEYTLLFAYSPTPDSRCCSHNSKFSDESLCVTSKTETLQFISQIPDSDDMKKSRKSAPRLQKDPKKTSQLKGNQKTSKNSAGYPMVETIKTECNQNKNRTMTETAAQKLMTRQIASNMNIYNQMFANAFETSSESSYSIEEERHHETELSRNNNADKRSSISAKLETIGRTNQRERDKQSVENLRFELHCPLRDLTSPDDFVESEEMFLSDNGIDSMSSTNSNQSANCTALSVPTKFATFDHIAKLKTIEIINQYIKNKNKQGVDNLRLELHSPLRDLTSPDDYMESEEMLLSDNGIDSTSSTNSNQSVNCTALSVPTKFATFDHIAKLKTIEIINQYIKKKDKQSVDNLRLELPRPLRNLTMDREEMFQWDNGIDTISSTNSNQSASCTALSVPTIKVQRKTDVTQTLYFHENVSFSNVLHKGQFFHFLSDPYLPVGNLGVVKISVGSIGVANIFLHAKMLHTCSSAPCTFGSSTKSTIQLLIKCHEEGGTLHCLSLVLPTNHKKSLTSFKRNVLKNILSNVFERKKILRSSKDNKTLLESHHEQLPPTKSRSKLRKPQTTAFTYSEKVLFAVYNAKVKFLKSLKRMPNRKWKNIFKTPYGRLGSSCMDPQTQNSGKNHSQSLGIQTGSRQDLEVFQNSMKRRIQNQKRVPQSFHVKENGNVSVLLTNCDTSLNNFSKQLVHYRDSFLSGPGCNL